MISPAAKQAFASLFLKSIQEALHQERNPHQWQMQTIPNIENIRAKEFVVLTICSYSFRIFATLHFSHNQRTQQYIAEILQIPVDRLTRDKFIDRLSEYGNIYCGALKRELGRVFPHLGMSTPTVLEERSFIYFSHLKYEHELHAMALSEKKVALYFGLYICPYGELDFKEAASSKQTATTGELELF